MSVEADVAMLDWLHELLLKIERIVLAQAREADPVALQLPHTVAGVGKIIFLVILYEVEDIRRFEKVGRT